MRTITLFLMVVTSLNLFGLTAASGAEKKPKQTEREANLAVDVSAALIDAAVRQSIDRTEHVAEVIQDTPVQGQARTIGAVGVKLRPNRAHAELDIEFHGGVWARTVGERPHVFIHTHTATTLEVRRRITVDRVGIHISAVPTCGETISQLLGIESRTRPEGLTIKLAERGYAQSQAAADAETSAKTAVRIAQRMDNELTPSLARASNLIGTELKSLHRLGLKIDPLEFRTTADYLQARAHLVGKKANVPGPLPSLPAGADLGVRIHQSAFNAVYQAQLSGRTFRLDQISKLFDEVTRGALQDARKDTEKKIGLQKLEKILTHLSDSPVTIAFAKDEPITTVFADGGFRMEIRLASVREKGVTYVGQRLKVAYRLENSQEGVHLVRSGRVQLEEIKDGPKAEPLPLEFRLLQEVLFDEVLLERFALAPLPIPKELAQVRLQPPHADAADGWLTLTWKLMR